MFSAVGSYIALFRSFLWVFFVFFDVGHAGLSSVSFPVFVFLLALASFFVRTVAFRRFAVARRKARRDGRLAAAVEEAPVHYIQLS